MKKFLALVLALIMALALVACGEKAPVDDQAGDDGAEVKTELKLASHNAIIEGNPYRIRYEADIQEAAAAAADHGLNVSYASFVSNWDAATESQQIENSINKQFFLHFD